MNKERRDEIKTEAKRRVDLWLSVCSFDEMTVQGSYIRFDMAIGLGGYPFKKEDWMTSKEYSPFVSDAEFLSDEYDQIIEELFETTMRECANKNKTT